jgi:hypothetical protein
MFLDAARVLAHMVSPADLDQGRSTPSSRAFGTAHMPSRAP